MCICADNTDAQRAWSLRQHRVNVTIDATRGPGNATILFVLSSRHRNASDTPSSPTYMLCGPVVHDITCNLWNCEYGFVGGVVTYTWYEAHHHRMLCVWQTHNQSDSTCGGVVVWRGVH